MIARLYQFVLIVALGFSLNAQADISFEVVGVGGQQYPVAITPFSNEVGMKQPLTAIISSDLARSGLFKLVNVSDMLPLPASPREIKFDPVKARGAQTQLIGTVSFNGNSYSVKFWLVDLVSKKELFAYEKQAPMSEMRRIAHEIADLVYEKLTGERGVFATRIAFVVKQARQHALQVADADGYGARTIISSPEPIISPKWSPDGMRLAYVSFERKKPVVFVQHLDSGNRQAVAAFKGNNSAPAWSPDGSQLAVVLTRDGTSQIYLIDAHGGGLRRLSNNDSIDTEPAFSPDGRSIIFTSDRGGSPQIYQIPTEGGAATRLTYEGNYNAAAKFSPDGKSIVMIQRTNGGFQVAVMDLATRQVAILTESSRDDSPSFAPNGRMILYESEVSGRGTLAAVSSDGRVKQRLIAQGENIRQPAWGPLSRR
jgi:TolB protein